MAFNNEGKIRISFEQYSNIVFSIRNNLNSLIEFYTQEQVRFELETDDTIESLIKIVDLGDISLKFELEIFAEDDHYEVRYYISWVPYQDDDFTLCVSTFESTEGDRIISRSAEDVIEMLVSRWDYIEYSQYHAEYRFLANENNELEFQMGL